MAFRTGSEMLDTGALAEEAVREGTAQFGAAPVASGTYRVLFRNITAVDFFEAFVPMFSADNAQKGLSPLAGREGETIASAAVTLCDDPLHAVNPRAHLTTRVRRPSQRPSWKTACSARFCTT